MQSLRDDAQYSNYYTLLELFAWGTWAEYQGAFFHTSALYST
jgi:COP9 signalosome complex subunit 7